jgi:hypothetical protein
MFLSLEHRWAISFIQRLVLPIEKRLNGSQSRNERCVEQRTILPPPGLDYRFLGISVHRLVTMLTELFGINIHLIQIVCFWTLSIILFLFKINFSDTGLCLRLQVKPTQLGPIDRASPYLRTPVPAPRWGLQAKHSTNHLRELIQNIKILMTPHV